VFFNSIGLKVEQSFGEVNMSSLLLLVKNCVFLNPIGPKVEQSFGEVNMSSLLLLVKIFCVP
jgi:hypothetical protein